MLSIDWALIYQNPLILDSFDIQRFASAEDEGRTEQPSEQKKRRAREEGNIPTSQELTGLGVFLSIFFSLVLMTPYLYRQLTALMLYYFDAINSNILSPNDFQSLVVNLIYRVALILGPVFIVGVIAALTISLAQTRFLFTFKKAQA